jgi:hypothetical protein
MAKSKPVDVDLEKATPVEPGDPVEAVAVTQMGATFAERQKAREKAEKKAVASSSSSVENKAAKKTSRKKS